jgi:hypothetical protein
MIQPLLLACFMAVLWLVPAWADESETAPVRCGTRWLMEQRAAGRMLLPASPPTAGAAKVAQDTTAIQVGTELLFPVAGSITLVAATCQRVGDHVYIFVENRHWDTNGGSILQTHVDVLGELFDHSSPADPTRGVYELSVETFGEPADVDGDDRIFLLVLDIRNDPNIVGLFDPGVANYPIPEYRRDVLFLDETFLRRRSYLARGTLAHEFQHLIHWRWDDDEELWIDEGLAGYAEELVGFPEADPAAVPEFLKAPHTSLTDWNFIDQIRSFGVTYLFISFLAERYGRELIREVVAQPRHGTAGVDAAMAARQESDRFVDAWQMWTVGNYAFQDERYAYGGLGNRRVTTLDVEVDMLPLQSAPVSISGRWGTANILFRTPGDLLIDFDGDDAGLYAVWTYAMGPTGGTLLPVALDAGKRGVAQFTGIDSVVLIVGRRSEQGQNFQLSARALTPTVMSEAAATTPASAAVGWAYPNPFNSRVRIPYTIATHGDVELVVFDLAGQRVRRLTGSRHAPGQYEAEWDGLDTEGHATASGTYLARLQIDGNVYVTTLSLIR